MQTNSKLNNFTKSNNDEPHRRRSVTVLSQSRWRLPKQYRCASQYKTTTIIQVDLGCHLVFACRPQEHVVVEVRSFILC